MSLARLLSCSLLVLAAAAPAPAAEARFALPANPLDVVTDEAAFRGFAEKVAVEIERLLATPAAIDDRATLNLALATRVHLAHHFGDNEKAIATAAWIRTLQTDPALRAYAGLTTLAAVEARRRHPGEPPDSPAMRATFRSEFARHLGTLPRTPEIAAMLRGQRAKIAALSREALLAEARDVVLPAIARRGFCGLAEADQLVRVRHRLESIVPLKAETLALLDAALAERPPAP